jgi:membrane-associated phospholipid phosphatase
VKDFLKNNFWILFLYILTLSAAAYFIFQYEKIAINLYVNRYVGNKFVNGFFYYITYLGDGRLAGILLLVILLYNVRLGLCATFSFLSATIVANTLKYFFFDNVNRPSYIFRWIEKHPVNYVEGVDMHIHNSFPSGHATQAFAILLCMAFATGKYSFKYPLLILAILTSFSRVYLSQHWLVDVTAGSLIGTGFSVLYYYLFIHKNKFEKLNKSLFAFKTG